MNIYLPAYIHTETPPPTGHKYRACVLDHIRESLDLLVFVHLEAVRRSCTALPSPTRWPACSQELKRVLVGFAKPDYTANLSGPALGCGRTDWWTDGRRTVSGHGLGSQRALKRTSTRSVSSSHLKGTGDDHLILSFIAARLEAV